MHEDSQLARHCHPGAPFRVLATAAGQLQSPHLRKSLSTPKGPSHPGGAAGLGPALNNKPLPGAAMSIQIRKDVGTMPGFPEELLTDSQVAQIVAYVNKLQQEP